MDMQISKTHQSNTPGSQDVIGTAYGEQLRAIAYSMDTLVPGVYVWLRPWTLRWGGCTPDDQPYRYPGTIHSRFGLAIVLPGYRIFTTYKGSYDPGQASN